MPVAIAASLIGLVVVLVAYYRDAPVVERSLDPAGWDLLPDPGDVARTEFPLSFPGYEPATVEFHFDLLTRAYADLLAVAPPDVIARARARAAMRRGIDIPDEEQPPPPASYTAAAPAPQRSTLAPLTPESADVEALRAEAALADLDQAGGLHR
jgi:hypothetical protein